MSEEFSIVVHSLGFVVYYYEILFCQTCYSGMVNFLGGRPVVVGIQKSEGPYSSSSSLAYRLLPANPNAIPWPARGLQTIQRDCLPTNSNISQRFRQQK